MTAIKIMTQRREPRLPIASIVLPFLGVRIEDGQCFEYLLQDISQSGVKIVIPKWLHGRDRLHPGQRIDFHVPFDLYGRILNSGVVAWEHWDDEADGQAIGAAMDQGTPVSYPILIRIESGDVGIDLKRHQSSAGLVASMAKDALLLKRGILIYLRHLAAYFSRLVEIAPQDYEDFRTIIIEDITDKVRAKADMLSAFHDLARTICDASASVCDIVSLENLRQAIEPDIYVEIFRGVLENTFAMRYLMAIKQLERKILTAYNAIVIVYSASL